LSEEFGGWSGDQSVFDNVLVEQPKNESYGDLYTNAAMVFSKILKIPMFKMVSSITACLKQLDIVESVSPSDDGFVNFTLHREVWSKVINDILVQKADFSSCNVVYGDKMNVEYVSANPTGPMHTGHARNAVIGSVLCNLLEKVGYVVTREFYVNDNGRQISLLVESLFLRYKEILLNVDLRSEFSDDMYKGEYLVDLAHNAISVYGDKFLHSPQSVYFPVFREFSLNSMLTRIKEDLELLGVDIDVYSSEQEVVNSECFSNAIEVLEKNGDMYKGVLPPPKWTEDDDWEPSEQVLFRSTKYGDDSDRTLIKSDGGLTYFAGDVAYHFYKISRGFKKLVNVMGADHSGYVQRLKALVKSLSSGDADLNVVLYQLVNFTEGGVPVKMSKRSGNFITLREVVERVGPDVTRFIMSSRRSNTPLDFDFVKVTESSMDNPVFYVQYAYARICSVFNHSFGVFGEIADDEMLSSDKSLLADERELALLKTLHVWPSCVKGAAIALEPHRITGYLTKLAHCVHSLWNRGKVHGSLRFVDKDRRNVTVARLSLLKSVKIVLHDGLYKILGIQPMEKML
jgi:arginyl-tRNA synthetase